MDPTFLTFKVEATTMYVIATADASDPHYGITAAYAQCMARTYADAFPPSAKVRAASAVDVSDHVPMMRGVLKFECLFRAGATVDPAQAGRYRAFRDACRELGHTLEFRPPVLDGTLADLNPAGFITEETLDALLAA